MERVYQINVEFLKNEINDNILLATYSWHHLNWFDANNMVFPN